MPIMIRREQIEELLKMPVDERRRVLRLLQASLPGNQKRGQAFDSAIASPSSERTASHVPNAAERV